MLYIIVADTYQTMASGILLY